MREFKPLYPDAIPSAHEKAVRYRLLNEPADAESICRDILRTDPNHAEARVTLLLALTDQFEHNSESRTQAQEVLGQFTEPYDCAYYAGIIAERWGKAMLRKHTPGQVVANWLYEAMRWYAEAEAVSPPSNNDAVLRWNACARILQRIESPVAPTADPAAHGEFHEEAPFAGA